MFLLLLALGCGTETVTVDAQSCTDYVFSDEPFYETTVDGGVVDVRRVGVFHTCDADFDPLIEFSGREIHIYEAWVEGESTSDCCFEAIIQIGDTSGSHYDVTWHATGDGETWSSTVEF